MRASVCLTSFFSFIFYYSTTFFQQSGIKDPFLISIATDVVNVGATPFSWWGIEHFGRRKLLIWGKNGSAAQSYLPYSRIYFQAPRLCLCASSSLVVLEPLYPTLLPLALLWSSSLASTSPASPPHGVPQHG
jgi:hypothetical protein